MESNEPKIKDTYSIGEVIINPKMLKDVADRIASTFDGEYDVNVAVPAYVTTAEFASGKSGRFLGFELVAKSDSNVASS